MIYVIIIMALASNLESDKSVINQTWILVDFTPKGWHSYI